jgi:AraC-like DNA-binding protein
VAPLSTTRAPEVIRQVVPRPELRPFVDLIWQYDGLIQSHELERVLPTGTMQIIINLAEDASRKYDASDPEQIEEHSGAIVSGPHGRFFLIDTAEQASVVGISFTPGGAAPFLGMPASELRDLHVSLEDLFGGTGRDLREQLIEAETSERFRILEDWLLARANGRLTRHPAVAYALTEFRGVPSTRSVSDVTERAGLSSRRFIELFDAEVGLTPKLFCRIKRFQHALRIVQQTDVDWADLAAMAGYYDQSHMIRDFQEFCGLNPGAYLKQRGPHLNHVPLPA